jgi:hypothetical protein
MAIVGTERSVVSVIGGVIGGLLLVIGLVALARTGIPAENLTEPTTTVGPFSRTPLMAIIEILAGLLVVAASVSADRGALYATGFLFLVFGIVWMIEPGAFQQALGVGRETAILYVLVGVVSLVGAMLAGPRGTLIHERREVGT